jgi:hypothetical protein
MIRHLRERRRAPALLRDFLNRRNSWLSKLQARGGLTSVRATTPQLSSLGLTERSSIPEALMINREAAAYWITRFRG